MYTPPWIPRADGSFRAFAQQFCGGIHAHPSSYMMTVAEAASLTDALARFNAAFSISSNPATRTRGTIADKDDARSILQDKIESYGAFIRVNRGITDGDKLSIGVRPRNIAHARRKCPSTPPLLNYIGSLPGIDQLVYHDSNTPTSKAKPRGAERLELWVAYAGPGEPPPKVSQATLVGSFKQSKMLVDQDPKRDMRLEGAGKPTYWARWVGYDSEVGPWSIACSIARRRGGPVESGAAAPRAAAPGAAVPAAGGAGGSTSANAANASADGGDLMLAA